MPHQNYFEYQPTKDLNRFLREYGVACLSDTLPPPPDGNVNIAWQTDMKGNISANVPIGSAGGLITLNFITNPIFNGALGDGFELTLHGDATPVFININNRGVLNIRIIQDGAGDWLFNWPSNFRNAGDINPGVNARSTQSFLPDGYGGADALGPIMYS